MYPNLVLQAREFEDVCGDCKLTAPLGFFRGFGPRFRVLQLHHFFACASK